MRRLIVRGPGLRGPQGQQGEDGPNGPQGPQGPQGLPGPNATPADEAVAEYVGTSGTSATKTALLGLFVPQGALIVNAGDTTYGSAATQAKANTAITAVQGSRPGRVLVPASAGTWSIGRRISGDQKSGGLYVNKPNITLESDGALLSLTANSDFVRAESTLGTAVTITTDLAATDRTIQLGNGNTGTFSVGQLVILRLGQADYDAFEPDFWIFARIVSKTTSAITIDRNVGRALTVAGVANAAQKAVVPITSECSNFAMDGTWQLVNPATGNADAEAGVALYYVRGARIGTIIGTTTGAAAVGGQFCEDVRINAVQILSSHAQNGHSAKGRGVGFSESRNVVFGDVSIEDFERSAFVFEARAEGMRVDRARVANTYSSRTNTQPLISCLGNSKVEFGELHLTGAGSVVYSDNGTSGCDCSIDNFYAYTSDDPTFADLGIVKRKLFVRNTLFTRRATYRRRIELTNGMNTTLTLPKGLSTRFRVYASSTTGITDIYVGSGTQLATTIVSSLAAGATYDYANARGFGSGYPVNSDTGKRFVVTTGTVPAGAYLVIEMEYWADPAQNGTDAGIEQNYNTATAAHASTHRAGGTDDLYANGGHSMTARMETLPRWVVTNNANQINGSVLLSYFTADKAMAVTGVAAVSGSTATAGATLIRMGLYSVAANGDLTLVSATANDTTLFNNGNVDFRKVFDGVSGTSPGGLTLAVGQRYAVGLIVVGSTTGNLRSITNNSAMMAYAPRMAGQVSGQTDLPSTVAVGSVSAFNAPVWHYLS